MSEQYVRHFTPSFLFLEGDHSLMQSISGYGQLHLFYALLLPLGIASVIRDWRRNRFGRFLIWWILIAPIPAAASNLGGESGHCLRAAGALPAYDILAAIGLDFIFTFVSHHARSAIRWASASAMVVVGLSGAYFSYLFFWRYPVEADTDFLGMWRPVLKEVAQRESSYDAVVISHLGSGYVGVLYLFWSRTDPHVFHQSSPSYQSRPEGDYLLQYGKFCFASFEALDETTFDLPPGARLLVAERAGIKVPGIVLKSFPDAQGRPYVVLYEVRLRSRPQSTTIPTSP
jgi:hypothetical protein